MKISKSSWLYKLHGRFNTNTYWELQEREVVTICQYFWASFFLVINAAIAFICMTVTAVLALNAVIALLMAAVLGVIIPVSAEFAIFTLTTFGGVAVLIGVFKLLDKLILDVPLFPEYMSRHFPKKGIKISKKPIEHKPSVILEYYKAYKNKFCTIVKLEE